MQTSWIPVQRPLPLPPHLVLADGRAPRLDARGVAAFLLPYVIRAHARGELTLHAAIARCRELLELTPFAQRHERQEELRRRVIELLRTEPRPTPACQQAWWTEACHDLVGRVSREEGLAIARIVKHGETAFERAAALLVDCGVPATASSVEKARSGWRRMRAAEPA